jgi:hypothetical protein
MACRTLSDCPSWRSQGPKNFTVLNVRFLNFRFLVTSNFGTTTASSQAGTEKAHLPEVVSVGVTASPHSSADITNLGGKISHHVPAATIYRQRQRN